MLIRRSVKRGFSFGLTSGVITTLGLIVGLNSGTHSRFVVLGGILVIAVADALSDALGMHMSEEIEKTTQKNVWLATASTMFFKFVFAMSFAVPVLLLELSAAVMVSIAWGLLLISLLSCYVANKQNVPKHHVIAEHLAIATVVIVATYFIGNWVSTFA